MNPLCRHSGRSPESPYLFYVPYRASAPLAASSAIFTSASPCAAPTKAASYWLGGSQTPASNIRRWKRPNASVSEVEAVAKSVTGPLVKNQVNIDPTRLVVTATPASRAS